MFGRAGPHDRIAVLALNDVFEVRYLVAGEDDVIAGCRMQRLKVVAAHLEGDVAEGVGALAKEPRSVRTSRAGDHLVHVSEELFGLQDPFLARHHLEDLGWRPRIRTIGSGVANERTTSVARTWSFIRCDRAAARSNSNAPSVERPTRSRSIPFACSMTTRLWSASCSWVARSRQACSP